MSGYLVVGALSALITWLVTPLVRGRAIDRGYVVMPDKRRVHEQPTPTLGGAAMYIAFLVSMGVASQLGEFDSVFSSSSAPIAVVLGATLIFAVGVLDDLREVSAPAKMAGQVFAGSVLYLLGVSIFFFRIPFADFIILSPDLIPLVTVLWVVMMANAVNLIDGLDGLAAGLVAIAGLALFLYDLQLSSAGLLDDDNISPLLAVIMVGMCIGFLPHNFHPARIFMGDGGALLLGLLMAASTMSVGGQTADAFSGQTYFFFAPLLVPLFILGVPLVDLVFAVLRRATRRQGLATADKGHLHHRLMNLGYGQRRSVVLLWIWSALLSALVLYPTYTGAGDAVVPIGVGVMGLFLYTIFHPGFGRRRAATSDDQAPSEVASSGTP